MNEKELSDLQMYDNAISKMAQENSTDIFLNSGDKHAKIIFKHIFFNSKRNIRILANDLNNDVTKSECYRNSLLSFLNQPEAKLQVIVTYHSDDKKYSPLFRELYPYKDKITVKSLRRDIIPEYHICIGDDNKYRLEYNTTERKAEGCFGDKEYVKTLNNYFAEIWNNNLITEEIDMDTIINRI